MTSTEQKDEYRKKAEEAEALAETTDDPAAKETWKRIAKGYRDLAQIPDSSSRRLL